jgi:2',3'-cyclic-nucleotide 2'-phosphodiesterase (5'-nucleotidase family)
MVTHSKHHIDFLSRPHFCLTKCAPRLTRAGLMAFVALLFYIALCERACSSEIPTVITVVHTNDMHSHLAPDASGDEPVGGIARIAGLISKIRTAEEYVIVLDAGDFLSGTPFHTFYGGRAEIECMNAIGYDAVAVGNHELDKGLKKLFDLSESANFPFMSANLTWRQNGERVFQPYMYFEAEDVTIALLALTTDDIYGRVRPSAVAPLAAASPLETAKELVPQLRRQAQAVIVLSHIGVEEDQKLAREVPGIDLIVGGDSHTKLDEPIVIKNPLSKRPTYIVQTGSYARHLGRADLIFLKEELVEIECAMIPVRTVAPKDRIVSKIVTKYWTSMEKIVTRVVAHATGPFPRDNSLRTGEAPLGNLIADITRHATGADFAIQNAGGIRDGFARGPITVWDVYQALPFDNRLLKLELSGAEVEALAGDIARRLGRSSFCQVSGISFTIRNGKAYDVEVAGSAVDKEKTYTLGVIDFLAEGGDRHTALTKAKVLSTGGCYQRDAAVDYFKELKTLRPRMEGRIKIAG